jgi:hypothetical protein
MVLFQKVQKEIRWNLSFIRIDISGFTDPVNVKFANTPNAAKSMIGLPLAPSYLPGIPTPQQQPVLTTVPPIRQQLNRYRYAARENSVLFLGI